MQKSFILTMRNLNTFETSKKVNHFVRFILTMRNLNENVEAVGKVLNPSFILTMRNLNIKNLNIYVFNRYVLY